MMVRYECGCSLDFEIAPNLETQYFTIQRVCKMHYNAALEIAYNRRVGDDMRHLEDLKKAYEAVKKK